MLVLEPSAADEDMEDGGHEWKIRRFVKFVGIITLFFKLVVLAVFWKDSLDFRKIIRKKQSSNEEGDNIDLIVAQYQQHIV